MIDDNPDGSYRTNVYAVRCADGSMRHLPRPGEKSRLDLVQRDAERKDITSTGCAPHRVVGAVVSRTAWQELPEDIPTTADPAALREAASRAGECPKCDARIGALCENLTARRLGHPVTFVSWPHRERLDAWSQIERLGLT